MFNLYIMQNKSRTFCRPNFSDWYFDSIYKVSITLRLWQCNVSWGFFISYPWFDVWNSNFKMYIEFLNKEIYPLHWFTWAKTEDKRVPVFSRFTWIEERFVSLSGKTVIKVTPFNSIQLILSNRYMRYI